MTEPPSKSKAILKRERREKQEAQRAAKVEAKGFISSSSVQQCAAAPVKQEHSQQKQSQQSQKVKLNADVRPEIDNQKESVKKTNQQKQPAKGDIKTTPKKDRKQSSSSTGQIESKETASTENNLTKSSTGGQSKTAQTGQALGRMRMDDPAHFKKSVRALQKKRLHPRAQEPFRVNLFSHLSQPDRCINVLGELKLGQQATIFPAFLVLGINIDEGRVSGSNKRCLEFLRATVALINSFPWTASNTVGSLAQTFIPVLVRHVTFLDQCRPLPVTIRNAVQFLKLILSQIDHVISPDEIKARLLEEINSFVRDRIRLAKEAIAALAVDSIRPGEIVCTYGHSSLVRYVLIRAWNGTDEQSEGSKQHFSVLVVDSSPRFGGRKMFEELRSAGIPCEITHIAALPMLAPKVSLTLLGAHSLLSNGHVIGSVGTAQVANIIASVAHTPILVCAETYKFWERAQSDAFEFNELGDPDDICRGPRGIHEDGKRGCGMLESTSVLSDWRLKKNLRLLNLTYDVLPPDLVTAVVTELGVLPTTSVPVVLRVKQASGDTEAFVY